MQIYRNGMIAESILMGAIDGATPEYRAVVNAGQSGFIEWRLRVN